MDNTREKLIELLSKTSCRGDGESLGSCPDRKYGICGEVANLSYCVIQNIANHLICNGVTLQDHDCCLATEIAYKNGYEAGRKDAEDEIRILKQKRANLFEILDAYERGRANALKWIPVTEELPKTIPCGAGTEYSEAVNVLTSGRKVLTAIFDGTDFIADAEFWEADGEEITHWTPVLLPLPEPPKGE